MLPKDLNTTYQESLQFQVSLLVLILHVGLLVQQVPEVHLALLGLVILVHPVVQETLMVLPHPLVLKVPLVQIHLFHQKVLVVQPHL